MPVIFLDWIGLIYVRFSFNRLKSFDERYDNLAKGRIAAIKPGYYTRMGAAIRQATTLLKTQKQSQHLLLLLTDGNLF